jgi:hypothetical protein
MNVLQLVKLSALALCALSTLPNGVSIGATIAATEGFSSLADDELKLFPSRRSAVMELLNLSDEQLQQRERLHLEFIERVQIASGEKNANAAIEAIRNDVSKRFAQEVLSEDQKSLVRQYRKFRKLFDKGLSTNALLQTNVKKNLSLTNAQVSKLEKIKADVKKKIAASDAAMKKTQQYAFEDFERERKKIILPHQMKFFAEHYGEIIDSKGKKYQQAAPRVFSYRKTLLAQSDSASFSIDIKNLSPWFLLIWDSGISSPIRFGPLIEILSLPDTAKEIGLSKRQTKLIEDELEKVRQQFNGKSLKVKSSAKSKKANTGDQGEANDVLDGKVKLTQDGADDSVLSLLKFDKVEEKKVETLLKKLDSRQRNRAIQIYRQYRDSIVAPSGIIILNPGMDKLLEMTANQRKKIRELKMALASKVLQAENDHHRIFRKEPILGYLRGLDVLSPAQRKELEKQAGIFIHPQNVDK